MKPSANRSKPQGTHFGSAHLIAKGIPPQPVIYGEKYDIICAKLYCFQHDRQTWHVRRIDGMPICLDCVLSDIPVLVPQVARQGRSPS